MSLQYNTYVPPLAVIAVEMIVLTVFVWRRHFGRRGVIPFMALMIGGAVWTLGYTIELAAVELDAKIFFTKIEYIGIVTSVVAFFLFVVEYTGRDHWLHPKYIIPLLIIPLITIVLVWTNEAHGLMYQQIRLDTSGPFPNFDGDWGTWFWVHTAYSYTLMLLAVIFLLQSISRSPQFYYGQTATLLIGVFAPWVGNIIHVSRLSPFPNLDITPFAFAITGLAFAWSMFGYRLLDVIPAARDAVFEGMDDAIIVLDMQDRIIDLNSTGRALLATSPKTAIGAPLVEILPDQRLLLEQFLKVGQLRNEITFGIDNAASTFEIRISSLFNRRGKTTGRLVVLRDITQRKQVERKLAEARDQALDALRLKSRILAVVSHDLRTPLGAILGYAEMLKEGMLGPLSDAQHEPVERIVANTNQLTELVSDLLDQAQLEAGKITIHVSQFTPSKLLNTVEATMGPKAKQKGLALKTEMEPDMPTMVRGDISRLNQVLTNLVGNALKFTEEGEIKVRIFGVDDTHWGIEVSDTGSGISPRDQEHIFDPFWQVDFSETREHRGVGLGLSIVQQLVQRLKGKITVESHLEEGTRFVITLPLDPIKETIDEQTTRTGY
ncbi:MAG: PAS domain-containing protein [Anaerolineae bacterium]|nr:PAS domain-containing protein [Anaerolineae bacterium]